MEIIKQGSPHEECTRCHCVMAYNSSDIYNKEVEVKIPGLFKKIELWKIQYIICPQCGLEIAIKTKCIK